MRPLFLAFVVILLTACGRQGTVTEGSATGISPTSPPAPTSTSSPRPAATLTPTSTPSRCDPAGVDFCVEQAWFIFQPPIAPPGTDTIDRSYPYGATENGTREPHHGVEFYNASGTPVLAAAGGTVYYAGNDATRMFSLWLGFYGNIVVLEHPLSGAPFEKLYTLYAHLSKVAVSAGQVVALGQKIGEVGATGTASGSHLHFEVRLDPDDYNSTLNPELWLQPSLGNGTLAFQFINDHGLAFQPLETKAQFIPNPALPSAADYYPEVYSFQPPISDSPFHETSALGDLPAGRYRITFAWLGIIYERWVEVQPGKLTRVQFTVK